MKKNLKEMIMSEMARQLVQQALDQDYNKASKTFGEIMSAKLSDVLDQEKIRIAGQIYNGVEPDDEDEEDILGDEDGDQLELDLETEDDDEVEEEETEDKDLDLEDEEETS
jgi:protein required for attachment to host cells